DQRYAQVGRCLEVVAGQYAQATRVVRQRGVDAELHREVRDRRGQRAVLLGLPLVPLRFGQVTAQVVGQGIAAVEEVLVRGELGEALRRGGGEHAQRVTGLLPHSGSDRGEQVPGGQMPGPAQVGRE